jgi:hypothetical protein
LASPRKGCPLAQVEMSAAPQIAQKLLVFLGDS